MIKSSVLLFLCSSYLLAAPITYTFQQLGTGFLGGTAFTDALVTLVYTGDTSGIATYSGSTLYNGGGSSTVTVAGFGTFTFNRPMFAYSNVGTPGAVAILDSGLGTLLLVAAETGQTALAGYRLNLPVSPITGQPGGNPTFAFPTSGGNFVLSSSTNTSRRATFSATMNSAIPEPSTVGLVSLGLLALLVRRRKK